MQFKEKKNLQNVEYWRPILIVKKNIMPNKYLFFLDTYIAMQYKYKYKYIDIEVMDWTDGR